MIYARLFQQCLLFLGFAEVHCTSPARRVGGAVIDRHRHAALGRITTLFRRTADLRVVIHAQFRRHGVLMCMRVSVSVLERLQTEATRRVLASALLARDVRVVFAHAFHAVDLDLCVAATQLRLQHQHAMTSLAHAEIGTIYL